MKYDYDYPKEWLPTEPFRKIMRLLEELDDELSKGVTHFENPKWIVEIKRK